MNHFIQADLRDVIVVEKEIGQGRYDQKCK